MFPRTDAVRRLGWKQGADDTAADDSMWLVRPRVRRRKEGHGHKQVVSLFLSQPSVY